MESLQNDNDCSLRLIMYVKRYMEKATGELIIKVLKDAGLDICHDIPSPGTPSAYR